MKHQYFADRRDFVKYELLLDLATVADSAPSLLSLLMLTPNDITGEGSVLGYELGERRPELYRFLRDSLAVGTRDVSLLRAFMARSGVRYLPHHDAHWFDETSRASYFQAAATYARQHALIFFDPDIGLQTGTASYMRTKGTEKYLMYADLSLIARAAPANAVLVIYQHLQRDKNRVLRDLTDRCLRLCAAVGATGARYVRDHDVAFIIATRDPRTSIAVGGTLRYHAERHGLEFGEIAA